ncbi:MAG: hypothetical protein KBG15_18245 [Kofleriaceae bacterium]|nr:hypothetical protein [Kofleriaceae bacterium]
MLKIDEFVAPDGTLAQTLVSVDSGQVTVHQRPGESASLPLAAIAVVMRRYGRPFDSAGPVAGELALPDGSRLWVFRHHAAVDATGRDYVAWQSATATEPPVAAIAITIAGAFRHLAQLGSAAPTSPT